jgi:DNA invertase Pin-like site-specific DNA recombinase
MKFGYARISTPQQSLENQIALLKDAQCDRIFSDVISGYSAPKKQFDKLMEMVRADDIVIVTGIDRLGRSTKDLAILLENFHENNIHLQILGYEMDTQTASGRMIFNFMAMIAENERMRNLERIRQGIEGARKRGKHVGRPIKLSKEKTIRMLQLFKSKQLSVKELCLMYDISKVTLYNYVKNDFVTNN